MTAILFDKPAERLTLGRNGYSKAYGIEVSRIFSNEVTLDPINSKGDIGSARLVVPIAHIRELRDALADIIFAADLAVTAT